jgi:hypothetical protein
MIKVNGNFGQAMLAPAPTNVIGNETANCAHRRQHTSITPYYNPDKGSRRSLLQVLDLVQYLILRPLSYLPKLHLLVPSQFLQGYFHLLFFTVVRELDPQCTVFLASFTTWRWNWL